MLLSPNFDEVFFKYGNFKIGKGETTSSNRATFFRIFLKEAKH